jgi:hypothetical protein
MVVLYKRRAGMRAATKKILKKEGKICVSPHFLLNIAIAASISAIITSIMA